jgi:hypothetical protein
MKKILIIPILLILTSCGYKSHYVKSNYSQSINDIDSVMIFVEYLHLKDDVGELWDFDENRNIKSQNIIFNNSLNMLQSKGYKIADANIKSSGINLDKNLIVEHYIGRELQQAVISPPFIIRTENLNHQSVASLEYLLSELYVSLDPNFVDRGPLSQDYLDTMNFKEYLQDIDIPNNTAVLVVQSTQLSTSAVKGIGIGLLFAAAANSNSSHGHGHVNIGFNQQYQGPAVNAYLLHKGTGDLLWANYSNNTISSTKPHRLFETFPQSKN